MNVLHERPLSPRPAFHEKVIKSLQKSNNTKRRELFDAQREELIKNIEKQLKQRRNVQVLFAIRWEVK